MSIALFTLICIAIIFFTWRNFMKNKEYATSIAEGVAKKHEIDLLDDTVCLRKVNIKLESARLIFYRVYSFDYNIMESFERYRAYIVLRNGVLNDVVVSNSEIVDIAKKDSVIDSAQNQTGNIIRFDD